ncbi:MAG: FliA/WhiG family RNA polymerase sigma factor [Calditrichaeota bacterium]|nr:FliA/WhiG family RNA polymerase sigma factor [Calditrichota bacterium]
MSALASQLYRPPVEPDGDVTRLWETYIVQRDGLLRERLLVHYIPLVKQVAGRMKVGLPGSVAYDDVVSAGLMGLLNCIDAFEPGRGFKFETFALPRIRGAILDGLREIDYLPRSTRRKVKMLDAATEKLTADLGRPPDDREVAEELGLEGEDYTRFMESAGDFPVVSLDAPIAGEEGETGSLNDLIPDDEADPHARLEEKDAQNCALRLIDELPEVDRAVIALYYYEELTLREIGLVLGVSESRVSQIHSRILSTLRGRLRNLLEK